MVLLQALVSSTRQVQEWTSRAVSMLILQCSLVWYRVPCMSVCVSDLLWYLIIPSPENMHSPSLCFALYHLTLDVAIFIFQIYMCSIELQRLYLLWIVLALTFNIRGLENHQPVDLSSLKMIGGECSTQWFMLFFWHFNSFNRYHATPAYTQRKTKKFGR